MHYNTPIIGVINSADSRGRGLLLSLTRFIQCCCSDAHVDISSSACHMLHSALAHLEH